MMCLYIGTKDSYSTKVGSMESRMLPSLFLLTPRLAKQKFTKKHVRKVTKF